MMIKKVNSVEEANYCDYLLSLLIQDEMKYNENIKDNYVVKNWYNNLYYKSNNALFISIDNKKIVGYIYVKITTSDNSPEKECEALIDGLYVTFEYRRRGIATSLINEAKRWCLEHGVKYLKLNVLSKNISAVMLYQKENFNEFSEKLTCKL